MGKKSKWKEMLELVTKWPKKDWDWRIRNLENLFDDPIDDIKHKVHGMKIFGFVILLPDWLMSGKGDPSK